MKSRFPFAKIAAALLCAAFSAVVSGCGGVYLNEKYELLDGTSPISGESGSKKSSEKKYALYVANPSLYSFRNNWKSDALQGHTYYGELSESRVSDLKSTFTFTSKKMTESEIQSYLTYSGESTREENITSLLGYSRGCLAFCPQNSSSVKIVLKTEDENTMELTKATDTGQLGINIEWNNYGYVGDYVYIFVDGEYEKTASTSAGSATIDGLTSGSHSVVLKNGNSSDAVEISNSKSVSLTLSSSLKYSLHAYNSGDGRTALLTIDSYSSNMVYVWVDGSYRTQTYFMSKYASISLSSGSHTIVLKDGRSSSAEALSNRCSVYIQDGDCEGPYTLSYDITSSTSVTLSWTGNWYGNYVYVWKDESCMNNRYGYSSSTITGLTAGSTYTFVLRENSTSGSPAISNSVTVTMPSSSSSSYTTLTVNAGWVTGNIPSGTQSLVYRFYASAGTTYTVNWADGYRGTGTGNETLDVKVSAYRDASLSDVIWSKIDDGYTAGHAITVSSSGYVYLKVEPYSSGSTGTFKIKVSN